MPPRYCKKCQVAFNGQVCPGGHPIYVYSKKVPDGVALPEETHSDEEDHTPLPSPTAGTPQAGAGSARKKREPASAAELSQFGPDEKDAQRERDRSVALARAQAKGSKMLARAHEPMMVAINAMKQATAEDAQYRKAPDGEKPTLALTVCARYSYALELAITMIEDPKTKGVKRTQLQEKVDKMEKSRAKAEATLEEGSEEALAAALEKVRAEAAKADSDKLNDKVKEKMQSWDKRWEEQWVESRKDFVPRPQPQPQPEPEAEAPPAAEAPEPRALLEPPPPPQAPEAVVAAAGLREVAAPADVTGDEVTPAPRAEAGLGPPPPGSGPMPTSDLLAGAAAQLAQALPQEDAEAVVDDPDGPAADAAAVVTERPTPRRLEMPTPRPRPPPFVPAPYTPPPAATDGGPLYHVGDSRRYLESSGILTGLTDALFALVTEPDETRPRSAAAAAEFLGGKVNQRASNSGSEGPAKVAPSAVNLVDAVSFDYLSGLAPMVHAALVSVNAERGGTEPLAALGEALLQQQESSAQHEAAAAKQEAALAAREEAAAALRNELSGIKLSVLKKRAAAVGVAAEELEGADDVDDTKGAVMELIMGCELAPASAAPSTPPQQQPVSPLGTC